MANSVKASDKKVSGNISVNELLSSLSEHSVKAVKEVLLDEEFIQVFASRLTNAMNGNNQDLVPSDDLDVQLSQERQSDKSFMILCQPGTDHQVDITVFLENGEETVLESALTEKIRERAMESFDIQANKILWVSLIRKSEAK